MCVCVHVCVCVCVLSEAGEIDVPLRVCIQQQSYSSEVHRDLDGLAVLIGLQLGKFSICGLDHCGSKPFNYSMHQRFC